eukprot:TRINITY_DN30679_c0_g1_i2.p1 TRINITY_DN30679_c0_g1~~TRINITY_DN30679_c0_g1_i2.p1  ORF type:complete len:500 (+),score=128.45 TRINITY_DN30679_c0_g1_i2:81-1502(+)
MAVGGRAALVLAVVGGAVLPPLCRYAAVVLQEQPQPPPRPAPQPPFRTPPPQHPPRALQPQPAAGGPRPPRQTPRPGPPELWGLLTERWEAAERPPLNCSSYHQAWGLLDATCHPPIRPCASSAAPDLRALAAWLPGRTLFLVGDSHIRWLFGQLWCMADAAGVVAAMTRWQPWHGQEYIVFRRSGQRGAAPDGAPLARSVYTWDWNARNRPRLPLTCLELTPDGGGDGSWAQPPPWHAKGPGPALPGAGRVCLRALYKSSRREVGRQYDHPADFLANVPLQGSDAVVIGIGTHYRAGDKLWVHEGDLRADARRASQLLATGRGLPGAAPAWVTLLPSLPQFHPTTDGLDLIRGKGGPRERADCRRPPAHSTWRNVVLAEEFGRHRVAWRALQLTGSLAGAPGTMSQRSFGSGADGWFGNDCVHFCQDVYSAVLGAALQAAGCSECAPHADLPERCEGAPVAPARGAAPPRPL